MRVTDPHVIQYQPANKVSTMWKPIWIDCTVYLFVDHNSNTVLKSVSEIRFTLSYLGLVKLFAGTWLGIVN